MIEPLREMNFSRSRAHDVAGYLAERIAEMPPGNHLGTKDELRQRLSVSVGTMNEAVRLLQERGLIAVKSGPRGGLFANCPDPVVNFGQLIIAVRGEPTIISEAEAIRNALEPLIVMAALEDRKRSDIIQLKRILKIMASNVSDPHAFLITNWDLHARIAECAKQRLLSNIYLLVLSMIRDRLKDVAPSPGLPRMSLERLQVHEQLIESIIRQDVPASKEAVALHDSDWQSR